MVIERPDRLQLPIVAAVLLLVGACAHTPKSGTPPAGAWKPEHLSRATPPPPAPTQAAAREACQLGTIYFAFDSALLDQSARDTALAAVSCYTHNGPPERLTLTGATDPRGTEEYNLALGHRRAAAVQNLLVTLGVAAVRISVTSLGEETATGSDESGWRLDRKVVATSE